MTSRSRDPVQRERLARECMTSFDLYFRTYWPDLVRFLKARASDTHLAEDIATEAMMAVSDNWDKLLTYKRPDSWLFKVALRKLRRVEARARHDGFLRENPESCVDDLRRDSFRDDWIEDNIDLISAVRRLRRRQCEVIGLHYLADYTIAETASILDMPVGTAKKHLNLGLAALRRHFGVVPTPPAAQGRISA